MHQVINDTETSVHWKEVLNKSGNPYSLSPRVGMLTPSGEVVLRRFNTPGRYAKLNQNEEFCYVQYDRDYVIEWLLKTVLNRFPGITHVQMRELMTEALKRRKERLDGAQNDKGE
jgi:hypothetical protein